MYTRPYKKRKEDAKEEEGKKKEVNWVLEEVGNEIIREGSNLAIVPSHFLIKGRHQIRLLILFVRCEK
jgi:hypothetical protein